MSEFKYAYLNKYDSFLCALKEKKHRYYVFFLFFYKDYFVNKILNKLMINGHKVIALNCLKNALYLLKNTVGFQPFFFFKHISFRMRQIFKVQKTVLRQVKVTYLPLLLKPHNQVTYGINHIIASSKQISLDENKKMFEAMSIVLINCFVYSKYVK